MRRYVVTNLDALPDQPAQFVSIAYLHRDRGAEVYLRREFAPSLTPAGDPTEISATLIISLDRPPQEAEVAVPIGSRAAVALFKEATARVFFSRFHLRDAGVAWDIDVLHLENDGLAVATCATAPARLPRWVGTDVTDDPRFTYRALASAPWRAWPDAADPFAGVLRAVDDPE